MSLLGRCLLAESEGEGVTARIVEAAVDGLTGLVGVGGGRGRKCVDIFVRSDDLVFLCCLSHISDGLYGYVSVNRCAE